MLPGPAQQVVDRMWRGVADARRVITRSGSAAPVRELLAGVRRSEAAAWIAATEAAQQRLRAEIPIASGGAAIVCVSMRPELVGDVVRHVGSQRHGGLAVDPDVVFVANAPAFADVDLDSAFREVPRIQILRPADTLSLGSALNVAVAATDARFVAKFDDDDRYGPHHLADSLRLHSVVGAGVVGKHTYVAALDASERAVIRFPGNEFRYSSTLAGGTLVIDRQRTGDLGFEDISLGEDRAFLRACHRRGLSTFSGDRFSFVQVRHDTNTWQIDERAFAADSVDLGTTDLDRILA